MLPENVMQGCQLYRLGEVCEKGTSICGWTSGLKNNDVWEDKQHPANIEFGLNALQKYRGTCKY